MSTQSINAYGDAERVRRYDAEMDLLHPNRHRMAEIAIEIIPYLRDTPLRVLDLGIGTGFLARRFLDFYPNAKVTGLDGSREMIRLARTRLQDMQDKLCFVRSSFAMIDRALPDGVSFDVVLSSLALHHLDSLSKKRVLASAVARLQRGGWLINADLVDCPFPELAERIQRVRAEGIARRNAGRHSRFMDAERVRAYIENLQRNEADQPLYIENDLALLREAGIQNATVFWQEYREAVYGGTRA
jgi:tRNA (cmo5U34)-methyltransferase